MEVAHVVLRVQSADKGQLVLAVPFLPLVYLGCLILELARLAEDEEGIELSVSEIGCIGLSVEASLDVL